MSAATQRIPVLVTPEEKEHIANLAREAGLSMGEFFRQAAAAYRPSEDAAFLRRDDCANQQECSDGGGGGR